MTRFKEKYGEIPNVSENKFFTNSMHVPVWTEISPFNKIDIEAELTPYSSAGCITYVELDAGVKNNIDALMAFLEPLLMCFIAWIIGTLLWAIYLPMADMVNQIW